MREDFDPEAGIGYVYARMADHIEARIVSGDLPIGARMLGERDLAEEYGVAIGTARRAMVELRERGLVVTLPAKGTYVVQREHMTGHMLPDAPPAD